jgi:RES domain-containing protein
VIVYRLARSARATLDGKGAADFPGRWNLFGEPCLYTSVSPSLAQLEVMVNIDDWKIFISVQHLILKIELPQEFIIKVETASLPSNWSDPVYNSTTQVFGSAMFKASTMLGFSVPSAVNKIEENYILNPRANNFMDKVKVIERIPFQFDSRLLSGI